MPTGNADPRSERVTVLVAVDRFPGHELEGLDVVHEPGPDVEVVLLMREVEFGAADMDAVIWAELARYSSSYAPPR